MRNSRLTGQIRRFYNNNLQVEEFCVLAKSAVSLSHVTAKPRTSGAATVTLPHHDSDVLTVRGPRRYVEAVVNKIRAVFHPASPPPALDGEPPNGWVLLAASGFRGIP